MIGYCGDAAARQTDADVADRAELVALRERVRLLEAQISEVYVLVRDGADGHRTPWGACYAACRVLEDEAPARFREPLDQYRNGGAL